MHISIIEPVGGHGGMDYYDYGLAYGLGENDVKVSFYTSDKTKVRLYSNVETKLVFNGVWGSPFLKKIYLYIKGHLLAYRASRKSGAKIVHLHLFFFRGIDLLMIAIAKVFKFRVVVTVHDVSSFHNNSSRIVEKLCYRLVDGVIVHNQASFDVLEQKRLKIKKTAIIPHGNYLPFISLNDTEKKASKVFRLLFFGQMKDIKGIDILLKAMAQVIAVNKNVQLTIAGRAYKNDLGVYENMIIELGLTPYVITDFRYIPDEEVASFFENADLIVLPYREIYQSGVLLLAMSYGRPLLCSDLLPFKEIIKDKGSGFLFKSEDDEDMAVKLLEIINNRGLLEEVSKNASKLIRSDFDWVTIGNQTREFYQNVSGTP